MGAVDAEILLPFLTQYGTNSISYSTLQSNLSRCFEKDLGFASYASHLGYNFVLGRPLCSDENLLLFLEKVIADLDRPLFIQIDEHVAGTLQQHFGYKTTQVASERFLNLQNFSLYDDPLKSRLRASLKRGREKARLYELDQSQLEANFGISEDHLHKFSDQWLKNKTLKNPLSFLIRKPVYRDEPYVRKFFSIEGNGDLLGFLFFSPIFKNRQVVGYCTDVMRAKRGVPYGHVAFMILEAIEKFKNENMRLLSLGLAPEVNSNSGLKQDKLTFHMLNWLYQYGNHFFNFRGIYNYKKQFGGTTKPSFIASGRTITAFESLALARYMGFL